MEYPKNLTNENILELLAKIEEKHEIIIIFCVEAGSRAWGLNGPYSDNDVRFVYMHNNIDWYLDYNRNNNDCIVDIVGDFDYQGWDIIKTIGHIKESNSGIVEWLNTPIVYIDKYDFSDNARKILSKMHTKKSLLYHYVNMAKRNWHDWICGKSEVICKKYFHVIRPMLIAQSLLISSDDNYGKLIVNIDDLLEKLKEDIEKESYDDIIELIKQKRTGVKLGLSKPIVSINKWFMEQIAKFEKYCTDEDNEEYVNAKSCESGSNFKVQSLISYHRKLNNENKKIRTLTSKHVSINRSDYLSLINIGLQFLWLLQHPTEESSKIPPSISKIIEEVSLPPEVKKEIEKVIENKTGKKSETSQLGIDNKTIRDKLLIPTIEFYELILMKTGETDIIIDRYKKIISDDIETRIIKDDMVEYLLRKCLETIYFATYDKIPISKIPKDIISELIFSEKCIDFVKEIIKDSKPKYLIENNIIINSYFDELHKANYEKIEETHRNLQKIREINTEKRLKNTIAKIDEFEFTELYNSVIKNLQ